MDSNRRTPAGDESDNRRRALRADVLNPARQVPRRDILLALGASLVLGILSLAGLRSLVPPLLFKTDYSTVMTDRNGRLIGATVAEDGQWRFPPDGIVPEKYVRALIAYEDRRFYGHRGVDFLALGRALYSNIVSGRVVSGGSTISMQVIRLSRGATERTVGEKLAEALLATVLELFTEKDKIVRMYAAHAPFGGNVVGLEAAAWRYFGRSPDLLSWAEAATLAVLPNSPALVHPGRNREELRGKRDRLLFSLYASGLLGEEDLHLALAEPLPVAPKDLPRDSPHALGLIRTWQDRSDTGNPETLLRALLNDGNRSGVGAAGSDSAVDRAHRAVSSIDVSLQRRVNAILARHHQRLSGNGIMHGAVLVLDVPTGRVLAYAGNVVPPGEDASAGEDSGVWNDMIRASRSTGSLLKPFLYAAMLESGELLPSQLVSDVPTRFGGYSPENNSKTYVGALPAEQALARSLNIPAVRMLRTYGLDRFYALLKKLGMTTLFRPAELYGLPLILGGAEGSLWEMTSMYAEMGRRLSESYASATDPDPGTAWAGGSGNDDYPFSASALWLTMDALSRVARPAEEAAWEDFLSSRRFAWKTGTSFGFRDAWAVGLNPRYAIGVWVGNASGEGRPELRGYSSAAPLMFDVLSALPDGGWWEAPQDLRTAEVCADSGYLAGPDCRQRITRLSTSGGASSQVCPYCRIVHLDRTGTYQVSSQDEEVALMRNEPWFVLPPQIEWYYRRANLSYRPLPPFKPGTFPSYETGNSATPGSLTGSISGGGDIPIAVIFPDAGARLFIPVELDGTPGMTVFQATHRNPRTTVYWHVDEEYIGSTVEIHQMEIRPGAGAHKLVIVDQDGARLERNFTVLSGD